MGFPKSVIGFGMLAAAASANAGILGYSADRYLVVDGGRTYSVIDVFVNCSANFDKLVNVFGQSASPSFVRTTLNGVQNAGDASSATNGAPFAQESGTGWMPTASSSKSWDSFVTIGARTQSVAQSTVAVSGDPNFVNAFTTGANTLQGGYSGSNYIGPGWLSNNANDASVSAVSYADKRLMMGRFTVDITSMNGNDVLTLQFKAKLSMRVNGTALNGGTITQPAIDLSYNYLIPAPGAVALVGLAGVVSRRRKA
jgi:hypothetical protein